MIPIISINNESVPTLNKKYLSNDNILSIYLVLLISVPYLLRVLVLNIITLLLICHAYRGKKDHKYD